MSRFNTYFDEYNQPVSEGHFNDLPTMTQQQFKDQCDIHQIIAKFKQTGQIDPRLHREPTYADVSQISSLEDVYRIIESAEESFASLSSDVRERFNNNPVELMNFLENPDNKKEAMKLGLLKVDENNQVSSVMGILTEVEKHLKASVKTEEKGSGNNGTT